MKLLLCILLATLACCITRTEATAQGSYGSHAYSGGSYGSHAYSGGSYGRTGVFRDGDGYVLPRRDDRVARRQDRRASRQARWGYGSAGSHSYGSAGSHGYGSAGSTSYEAAPVVEEECPVDAHIEFSEPVAGSPGGNCPKQYGIFNRKNPRWN